MSKSIYRKIKRKPVQWTRNSIQLLFALFLLYVGWQFYQFYMHFANNGVVPYIDKPSAVEGFLPISSLMALRVWIVNWRV
ncbi:hypothetical protein [Bacillus sp. Marseille-P3661]|uniref:hypothetical protein n=1 Tax=Bacillus sp. Marseille-P3661 TaxID=1936234 RepID=UPI0021558796|nr:hypothetical protein [Bacillus sp. Marseille-P3661]